jgi:hypothetical protein
MKSIRCSKLKRLVMTATAEDAVNVIAFLQNHPPLEELVIDMRSYFPLSILNVIQGRSQRYV